MIRAKLKWGIIGPGIIAKAFADALLHTNAGELVAVASRNSGKAELPDMFPGARIYEGYNAILSDAEVEAIYIATPHPAHAEWAIKCAMAGKHVLCEKPIGLTAHEAQNIFDAARGSGTFMGEAIMYRLHPQTEKMLTLLRSGAIGEIRMIKSAFGFSLPEFDPTHRVYAKDLAGGGILDVGIYPVSMARLIAGMVEGKPYANPVETHGVAFLGATGVDEWASAVLKFSSGIIAEVSCSVSVRQDNVLRILGTKGRMEIKNFWLATGSQGGDSTIEFFMHGEPDRCEKITEPGWLYAFEADAVAAAIQAGAQEFSSPGMTWDDTLGNMQVLDKWRQDVGLIYEIEKL